VGLTILSSVYPRLHSDWGLGSKQPTGEINTVFLSFQEGLSSSTNGDGLTLHDDLLEGEDRGRTKKADEA